MTYLFVYSDDFGTREDVKVLVEGIREIVDWRYDLPNAFYLVSDKTADQLADLFISRKPNGRFLITEIVSNRQGWLPQSTWEFLNKKR